MFGDSIARRTRADCPLAMAAGSLDGCTGAGAATRCTMVMNRPARTRDTRPYLSVAGNICPVACQVYEGLVGYDWGSQTGAEACRLLGGVA